MEELDKLISLYNLDITGKLPIEIPNMGREQLAQLFKTLGYKVGAEIGVDKGYYSETICINNPGVKLYAIDPWKVYQGYVDHTIQRNSDIALNETTDRLMIYNVKIIRKFSMDAVKDFQDNSLDFVYIDGNHEFSFVAEDMYYWSYKVRPGGIISGHDYIRHNQYRHCHVVDAVNGFTYAYRINPWFVCGTKEKVEGQIRENSRSWFWFKK